MLRSEVPMDIEHEVFDLKEQVVQLRTDLGEMKAQHPFLMTMLKENNETNKKLAETLHEIDKNMATLSQNYTVQVKNIEEQGKRIVQLDEKIDSTNKQVNERISSVKKQIDAVDNEGKFNIRTFFKTYFPWIVIVFGFGMKFVADVVKF